MGRNGKKALLEYQETGILLDCLCFLLYRKLRPVKQKSSARMRNTKWN